MREIGYHRLVFYAAVAATLAIVFVPLVMWARMGVRPTWAFVFIWGTLAFSTAQAFRKRNHRVPAMDKNRGLQYMLVTAIAMSVGLVVAAGFLAVYHPHG